MDKQAFKQRMQNLKSYRENNPGKGYWDWRNSLPDNLKYTDDTEYNMRGAYESGAQPILENDGFYHLPTRNPQTGEILKASLHPTFWKGLAEDAKIGYNAYFIGDKVYTKSKEEGPIDVYADGGEVGNPDDDFTKAINTKLGRTPDGRPKEQGLKPVFDLEDAANITPIGDALSARDVYNAVTEKDWTGAGLAALGILPFIPSGLRQLKPTARYIPSVSRSREQDLLNAAFDNIKQKREYLSDVANERNRVLESVNDYAHRVRAEKADQMFGTNYSDTYKLLSDLYEHKFFSLPEVQGIDMKEIGKMQAKDQANKNFIKTGIGAGPEDFDFLVNPYRPMAADELARHELNHYTDFIISRNRDTSTNNNMLKQLEASLKKTNDVKDDYFKLGTEQKAYMNQLRTRMYNDKAISSLEEPVSTALIKKYMDSLGDKDSIKRAYKQHKSLSAYTKWFNSIPLLGIGAIGVNKYFNNGIEQEK